MKTTIITLFTALVLSTGIATAKTVTTANNDNVTVLTEVSAINKIEVHGNVELFVSEGSADEVKVYNKYYAESALVQSANGVLRISSYKAEKLVVWITAKNLNAITAFDNASIKSFGSLSNIEFIVELNNNATAKLSLDTFNANVTVNDQAKAELSGTANEVNIKYSHIENVNDANLVSNQTARTCSLVKVAPVQKTELDELASL
jgi:hypothetical protein